MYRPTPPRRGRRRNVSGPEYREVMDAAPAVRMDALWPELAGQRRAFEVVVTVPRGDGGEPLVPRALPPEVMGCWSADQLVASVTLLAARPSGAVAAAEALVPELTRSPRRSLRCERPGHPAPHHRLCPTRWLAPGMPTSSAGRRSGG